MYRKWNTGLLCVDVVKEGGGEGECKNNVSCVTPYH